VTLASLAKEIQSTGLVINDLLHDIDLTEEMIFSHNNVMLPVFPARSLMQRVYEQLPISVFAEVIIKALRKAIIPSLVQQLPKSYTVRDVLVKFNLLTRDTMPTTAQYLEVRDNGAWFSRITSDHSLSVWEEIFSILYSMQLIRSITANKRWQPKVVALQQSAEEEFVKKISAEVQVLFSQKSTKISVDLELLDQTINTPYPQPTPRQIEWHTTFTDTVYTCLIPYVHEQDLDIERAANLLGMSTRTLQRKLQQEKSSFRSIKNNLMFNVACDLMSREFNLTQIAIQLGYADISHFSRAFKRFSGLTPKTYKNIMLKR
jgi:AraC-like DNA-binding protein